MKAIILSGLPRSGKTTLRSMITKYNDYTVISADDIRYLVHGQRFIAEKEPEVWKVREVMLNYLIKQRKDIIIDECNSSNKRIEAVKSFFNAQPYSLVVVRINTKKETCIQRAIEKDEKFLIPIIEKMDKSIKAEDTKLVNISSQPKEAYEMLRKVGYII